VSEAEAEDVGTINDSDHYICHDPEKNLYCTCAGSFEGCDCEPKITNGAPTVCKDCGSPMVHARACSDCDRLPCICKKS
jgi:hypothetical protein